MNPEIEKLTDTLLGQMELKNMDPLFNFQGFKHLYCYGSKGVEKYSLSTGETSLVTVLATDQPHINSNYLILQTTLVNSCIYLFDHHNFWVLNLSSPSPRWRVGQFAGSNAYILSCIYDRGDYIYIFGGFSNKHIRNIYRFNIKTEQTESWGFTASEGCVYHLAVVGQMIHVIGGYNHSEGELCKIYKFNTQTQQSSEVASVKKLINIINCACFNPLNQCYYFLSSDNKFMSFNPTTQETLLLKFPYNHINSTFRSKLIHDGKDTLYLLSQNTTKKLFIYSISTDQWSEKQLPFQNTVDQHTYFAFE